MRYLFICLFILCASSSLKAQQIPNFQLENLNGQKQSFNDLKGEKITIIDFWATFCKPCLKSIPQIEKWYQQYHKKGLNVIGVSADSPRNLAKVKSRLRALGANYDQLLDVNGDVQRKLGVLALPVLLITDAEGNLIYRVDGITTESKKEIEHILKEQLEK